MIHFICYTLMAVCVAIFFALFMKERKKRLSIARELDKKEDQLSCCWKDIAFLRQKVKSEREPSELCQGCKNLISIPSYTPVTGQYFRYRCRKDLDCKDYEEKSPG